MRSTKHLLGFLSAAFLLAGTAAATAKDTTGHIVVVIPARYRIVQLANDVASIRTTTIISYSGDVRDAKPTLHQWIPEAKQWTAVSIDEYQAGTLFLAPPTKLVLVGGEEHLPAVLADAPTWCQKVSRSMSLDFVAVVRALHEASSLTSAEWRWLAPRYELKLRDKNAARRRYGRYGKPGAQKTSTAPPESMDPDATEPALVPDAPDMSSEPVGVVTEAAPIEAATEATPVEPEIAPEDK